MEEETISNFLKHGDVLSLAFVYFIIEGLKAIGFQKKQKDNLIGMKHKVDRIYDICTNYQENQRMQINELHRTMIEHGSMIKLILESLQDALKATERTAILIDKFLNGKDEQ